MPKRHDILDAALNTFTISPMLGEFNLLGSTLVSGIIAATISGTFAYINSFKVEQLKAELAERKGVEDARRTYLFDNLKRLYEQYEPLRFHLIDACESAQAMIVGLAEKNSPASPNASGAIPTGNYLRVARVYQLLLPAAYFRTMRSRLTFIDLAADRRTHLQYLLAKQACSLLTQDREIATFCDLPYTPYVPGWQELRTTNPRQYRRQGFP